MCSWGSLRGHINGTLVVKSKIVPIQHQRRSIENVFSSCAPSLRNRHDGWYHKRDEHLDCLLCGVFEHVAIGVGQWALAQDIKLSTRLRRVRLYLYKGSFVEGLVQFIWHSMRSYWSSQKTALLQKLAYNTKSLTNLQAASRPGEQPHTFTNLWHKLNNRQSSRSQRTINSIGSSKKYVARQSYNWKGMNVAASNNASPGLSNNFTRTIVNRELLESVESAPFFMTCLSKWHKCQSVQSSPQQLQDKLKRNRSERVKNLQRREHIPHQTK